MDHADIRYLTAKRSVDQRALSGRVRDRVVTELPRAPRIVEAGPGVGLGVPRLLSWGVTGGSYRGIEIDPGVVDHARRTLPQILRRTGHEVTRTARGFRVEGLSVTFDVGDAVETLAKSGGAVETRSESGGAEDATRNVDLLLAQSFMDLVDLNAALDAFERALAPGGLGYFPITFDGETIFQPDHPRDEAVLAAYHRAIDAEPGRDSRAGRHLADRLRAREGDLLEMAASDWIVRPHEGGYPHDERYFLRQILQFVERALEDQSVDGGEEWLRTRRRQLASGDLLYVAHGYDLLYRVPES
jgi:hypothetical protein